MSVVIAFGEWLFEQGLLKLFRRIVPDPNLRRLAATSAADPNLRRHRRRLLRWLRSHDAAHLLNQIDLPGSREALLESLAESLRPRLVHKAAHYTPAARADAARSLLANLEPGWVSAQQPSVAASISGERVGRQIQQLSSSLQDRRDTPVLFAQLPPMVAQRFSELADLDDAVASKLIRHLLLGGSAGILRNLEQILGTTPPDWLTAADPFAWISLGEAAAAYSLPVESAQAFERGVALGASNPSRWLARASLSWAQAGNLEAARQAAARAASGPATDRLAAVVGAVLQDDAEGILQAVADAGDGHPEQPVLEGQAAVALHNLGQRDEAIERLRAAIRGWPGTTGLAILQARFLVARASRCSGDDREKDLTEALDLAIAARDRRREWGSASHEAIPVLCEAQIIRGDRNAVFRFGLAPPDGEATREEAAAPSVVEKTALLSIERGQLARAQALLEPLEPGCSRLLVEGAIAGADPSRRPEAVELLNQAFEAAADPRQRWTAVNRLADLGEWPLPGWDELQAIAPEQAEFCEALSLLRRGSFDTAVRLLRPKSGQSLIHAELLAQAYAKNGQLDAGIEAYRAAAKRFQDPDLEAEAALLLAQAGRWDEAQAACEAAMTRLRPGSVHWLPLRRALLEAAWLRQEWPVVIEHARWYLAREPQQRGIRWLLVGALHNALAFEEAWAALQAGDLEIEVQEQAELWVELAHRYSAADVWIKTALELYWRFPDSERLAETFLKATSGVPSEALDEATGRQIEAAVSAILTRYPTNPAFQKLEFGDDPVAALNKIKELFRPGAAQHAAVAKEVVKGDKPLGLLASVDGRPYTELLATGGTGFLNVFSSDPASREADSSSARSAINQAIVVDLSSLYTGSVLPDAWALVVAEVERLVIADVAFRDVVAGREALSRLSTNAISYNVEGDQLSFTELTKEEAAQRRDRTNWMAQVADRLDRVTMKSLQHFPLAKVDRFGGWLAGIELADQFGYPLLCDDASQREVARSMGINTFSTVHMLAVMVDVGRISRSTFEQFVETLRAARMVDLPYEPDKLVELAESEAWLPGIASLQLTRPAFWTSATGPLVYREICSRVVAANPDLLPGWVAAAAIGRSLRLDPAGASANSAQILSEAILAVGRGPIDVPPLVDAVRQATAHLGAPDPLALTAVNLRDRLTKQLDANSAVRVILGLAAGLLEADRLIISRALFSPA